MERKKILINNANPILFGNNAYEQLNNLIIQKSYSKILIFQIQKLENIVYHYWNQKLGP